MLKSGHNTQLSHGGHITMKRLKIDLDDIVMAMQDFSRDVNNYYLDTETGEVKAVDSMLFYEIESGEEPDDVPEWQKEEIPMIRAIMADDKRYRYIPENDSHEAYRLMEDFIFREIEDEEAARRLDTAIRGRGAFRCFKDTLYDFPELRKRWYEYEAERHHEWARQWLEEVGIEAV